MFVNSLPKYLLTELVVCGVAYHHAGLGASDRKSIEAMFMNGDLPVLCMKPIYELNYRIVYKFDNLYDIFKSNSNLIND